MLLLGYHLHATEKGLMRYAHEAGWTMDLRTLRSGALPDQGGVDGILCLLGGWESLPELTEFVRGAMVPVVDMHADEVGAVTAGRVLLHNVKCGELVAQHFAMRGYKRCLFCCRGLRDWSAIGRRRGFVETLTAHGIEHRIFEQAPGRTARLVAADMMQGLLAILEKETPPLGVFAENDDLATQVALKSGFTSLLHLRRKRGEV